MTDISTFSKQKKIWTTLFIFLLLCFSISATSPIKSISSVSLPRNNFHTVDTSSFLVNGSTKNMLRQRKTTPVKKALHARGGGGDNGGEENFQGLSSSIGLEKEMTGSEQRSRQAEQQHQEQQLEEEQPSQNPTSSNSATLETSKLIPLSNEKKRDADKSSNSVSGLRAAIFPIHGSEVKKFMLMGAIKFFVIMALTLTRDTKDTLVVTQCGAEAIAFLKVSFYVAYSFYLYHAWTPDDFSFDIYIYTCNHCLLLRFMECCLQLQVSLLFILNYHRLWKNEAYSSQPVYHSLHSSFSLMSFFIPIDTLYSPHLKLSVNY
jgi:hypothetical protein